MKYVAGLTMVAMLAGATALSASPPADPAAGATVFKKCASCHNVDPSGRNGLGPNLRGVVKRKAATAAGFTYSPAMQASKLTWNDATLDRFLTAPRTAVPGTKMIFVGLPNPQDRANVIAYLKQNPAAKK
ncbi:MAG: cytochrome c family protein [Sphingomonas bacterium]|uniref:c-type cytochrome n=1 Tax=Sphingomonas bacterium TaxID=1895847 RepID=UPI00261FA9C5|nr:cytochrome c family protein [Sphingomonas bacterium]MDB5707537.1 cytochrome c family protein [Sphingomonas bacterium]